MRDKRLVICDIDNTLIVKHKTLTPRARNVIRKLQDHGIYFGIASGRSLEEVKRMIQSWGYEDLDIAISMNGSTLWDGIRKQRFDYFKLKTTWIKEIMDLMEPFEHNPLIYRNDQLLCRELDELVKISAKTAQMEAIVVPDKQTFYTEENAKIMFRVNAEDMEQIEDYLVAYPSEHYHAFKTQSTLIEFCDRRVSKAYPLASYCDIHGFTMQDVLAFGDTTNDNTMLKESGIGVCMCNGSEDTLALADMISEYPCDEDGWAKFMEQHYLQERGWM